MQIKHHYIVALRYQQIPLALTETKNNGLLLFDHTHYLSFIKHQPTITYEL